MDEASRILVLGLGVSGLAVAEHLAEEGCRGAGPSVTVLDSGDTPVLRERAQRLRERGVDVRLGVDQVAGDHDLIVVSPGIPPHSRLVRSAAALGVPVISEIEFAYRLARSPFVAVTGTNGKTTVTSMIGHILAEAGVPAEMVGNIGTPVIGVVSEAGPATVLVTEVSSFQLASIDAFRPRVSVLLNITPDHLDWHGTMERYAADKARVLENQSEGDTAVVVVDDPGAAPYADEAGRRGVDVVRVSLQRLHPGGAGLVDGMLTVDAPEGPRALLRVDELQVRGEHNTINALAAAAAAMSLGVSAEECASALRTFRPGAHRLEPVGVVNGVEYFDDSKATNPDAALKALTAFGEDPIIILLGGRNKDNPFGPLALEVDARCKAAVLFGEAAEEISRAFHGLSVETRLAPRLADAVRIAHELAVDGDVVLLSPACASFDEFTGYAQRGEAFRAAVEALADGEATP